MKKSEVRLMIREMVKSARNENIDPSIKRAIKTLKKGDKFTVKSPDIKADWINIPLTFVSHNAFAEWIVCKDKKGKEYRVPTTKMRDQTMSVEKLNENIELNESQTDIMKLDFKQASKIIGQYEALRRLGQYNMFDFLAVQRVAYENKLYDFVAFTANNKKAYASIIKNYSKLIKTIDKKDIPKLKKVKTSYSLEGIDESNVFDKNQIAIAKKTLKMSDAGANAMGGMTKDEARAILKKHKIKIKEWKEEIGKKLEIGKFYRQTFKNRDIVYFLPKKLYKNGNYKGLKFTVDAGRKLKGKAKQTSVTDPLLWYKVDKMDPKVKARFGESITNEAKTPYNFECMECDHKFSRKTIPKSMEVRCPKCKSYDVDPQEF